MNDFIHNIVEVLRYGQTENVYSVYIVGIKNDGTTPKTFEEISDVWLAGKYDVVSKIFIREKSSNNTRDGSGNVTEISALAVFT